MLPASEYIVQATAKRTPSTGLTAPAGPATPTPPTGLPARAGPNRRWIPATAAWLLVVSGCELTPRLPSDEIDALSRQAESLVAAEQFEQSLRIYTQLVGGSSGSTRSGFLIAGARILLVLGAYDTAGEWLARADGEATPEQEQQIRRLRRQLLALSGAGFPATRIALLLPLTGPQRPAALAIQDGFLAAHLSRFEAAGEAARQAGGETAGGAAGETARMHAREGADGTAGEIAGEAAGETAREAIGGAAGWAASGAAGEVAGGARRPALHVYDTGRLGAREAYRRASDDGAEFIVGPLLKPGLEAIMTRVGAIPTLALNALEDGRSAPGLYQFALAPEDEARQVARYAAENGARNAVALIPGNDWGDRLLESFRSQLEALGGTLVRIRRYDPAERDYSAPITAALNIDRSDRRRRQLGADLGIPLEFEFRRRQDIDAIFIAADAGAARLLAPQLRFHFAGDIPTYGTSAIYESSGRNGDLDGLVFADTPWALLDEAAPPRLAAALNRYWPERSAARWIRFYGLGHDAYGLIAVLYEQPDALVSLPALSGELSLDETGRIRRELPLARFRDGRPVPVEPPDGRENRTAEVQGT